MEQKHRIFRVDGFIGFERKFACLPDINIVGPLTFLSRHLLSSLVMLIQKITFLVPEIVWPSKFTFP